MTRIAITGAAGRMGKTLIEAVQQTDSLSVCAAIERAGTKAGNKGSDCALSLIEPAVAVSKPGGTRHQSISQRALITSL